MKNNRQARIPELDGLRVLMIFVVSWYHIWQQSWLTPGIGSFSLDFLVRSGYVWVDGTVLLSAFLLFLPWARARRDGAPLPSARDFYARRVRRVLPSYYFILLLVFFAVCLPFGLYRNAAFMAKDLITHFTFTFTFWYDTYIGTQLGAASWTLAVEVQAYLLFPWIARAVTRKPALTLSAMLAVCVGFRIWFLTSFSEYNLVVNQLVSFLDVYVLGILLAMLYTQAETGKWTGAKGAVLQVSATLLFALACVALYNLLRMQAGATDYSLRAASGSLLAPVYRFLKGIQGDPYALIQAKQMIFRPAYALCFGALLISAPFSLKPLRLLLGNPVTRFLSEISMNYYLLHQTVIVHMKRLGFPASVSPNPHMDGERAWQHQYTFFAFAISLLLAFLVTYLVEKPAARMLKMKRKEK